MLSSSLRKILRTRGEQATATASAKAGPSTPLLAKCASNFALDDTSWEDTSNFAQDDTLWARDGELCCGGGADLDHDVAGGVAVEAVDFVSAAIDEGGFG